MAAAAKIGLLPLPSVALGQKCSDVAAITAARVAGMRKKNEMGVLLPTLRTRFLQRFLAEAAGKMSRLPRLYQSPERVEGFG